MCTKSRLTRILLVIFCLSSMATFAQENGNTPQKNFGSDKAFLQKNTDAVVLSDSTGDSQIIIIPQYQGRVMTSTATGDNGISFGWINYDLITSQKFVPHMNAFGGEDRFWMGPEGGQFGLYFPPKAPFDVTNWQVPAPFDTDKYQVIQKTSDSITLQKNFTIQNYSGTKFTVKAVRQIILLTSQDAESLLGIKIPDSVNMVGYVTKNKVVNVGKNAWSKDKGAMSIWVLGNYAPSEGAQVILPISEGTDIDLGKKVDVYTSFGEIPSDRLTVKHNAVYFKADGKLRSKIGLSPQRAKNILGSYDATNNVLTIVKYNKPDDETDYVNSTWEIQDMPFAGDVVNAYNDGPMPDGSQLGPFYELETSSPALFLRPDEGFTHIRYTFHLTGTKEQLNLLAKNLLGVSI